MKAYLLTVLVIDHDRVEASGAGSIAGTIEDQRYPNRCIHPWVLSSKAFDIGEWGTEEKPDGHPLNQRSTNALSWIEQHATPIPGDTEQKEWEAELAAERLEDARRKAIRDEVIHSLTSEQRKALGL